MRPKRNLKSDKIEMMQMRQSKKNPMYKNKKYFKRIVNFMKSKTKQRYRKGGIHGRRKTENTNNVERRLAALESFLIMTKNEKEKSQRIKEQLKFKEDIENKFKNNNIKAIDQDYRDLLDRTKLDEYVLTDELKRAFNTGNKERVNKIKPKLAKLRKIRTSIENYSENKIPENEIYLPPINNNPEKIANELLSLTPSKIKFGEPSSLISPSEIKSILKPQPPQKLTKKQSKKQIDNPPKKLTKKQEHERAIALQISHEIIAKNREKRNEILEKLSRSGDKPIDQKQGYPGISKFPKGMDILKIPNQNYIEKGEDEPIGKEFKKEILKQFKKDKLKKHLPQENIDPDAPIITNEKELTSNYGESGTGLGMHQKHALTNHEIDEIMTPFHQIYIGTFALDDIDNIIDIIDSNKLRIFSFIINEFMHEDFEDNKNFVGHWYAIHCDLDAGNFMFYDPLGEPISDDVQENMIDKFESYFDDTEDHLIKFKHNSIQQEPSDSFLCGFYCIRLLLMLYHNIPWKIATGFKPMSEQENDVERLKDSYEKYGYI
jgi:hypothetical protein